MTRTRHVFLTSVLLLFACPRSRPQTPVHQAQTGSLKVKVREYNYARVPGNELHAGEAVASRVVQDAGIEMEWADCTVPEGEPRNDSVLCLAPFRATDLILYLVDRLEAHFPLITPNALGYSIIPDDHGLASMAYVSYSRIRKLSASTFADPKDLLGLAVAHEIGHLLLGTLDHANHGVMRAPWRLQDLKATAWGEFEFTQEQRRRLRRAVEKRELIANRSSTPVRADETARDLARKQHFGQAKDQVLGGWSATLPQSRKGRVARHSSAIGGSGNRASELSQFRRFMRSGFLRVTIQGLIDKAVICEGGPSNMLLCFSLLRYDGRSFDSYFSRRKFERGALCPLV